jgi:ABC-type transporter Mla subunit MlaD
LDFKLNEIQTSITSLKIAVEELAASHPSTSMVIQSLNQVHQYLDSEHQEHVEEMSNIATILDNLESDSPFAGTADSHIYMLMV